MVFTIILYADNIKMMSYFMSNYKRLNKTNVVFFSLLFIVSIIGPIFLYLFSTITWPTWLLAAVMFFLSGLSITAGYHRLFTHNTYTAAWPVRLLFVLIGSGTFEGSVLEWATDHRNHHCYTDTEKDPYNIKQGFWHAHMGWLFTLDASKRDFRNVADLKQSRILRLQHRYYILCSVGMGFLFPVAIASLWGAPIAGLLIAGVLRITLFHQSTFCINSLCHVLGTQPYSNRTSARDNWLSALVTCGEGYHNYHHTFPSDYRNGVQFYQYDPGKWLIFGLSCIGLASNLRRIPRYCIIQARIETYKQLTEKKQKDPFIEKLHASIFQQIAEVKKIEKIYRQCNLKEYATKLKIAEKQIVILFNQWKNKMHKVGNNPTIDY
jgi:stearoyl-CoA desaturase (delta-9 desaturase)